MKGLKNFVFAMAIMLCVALLAKIDTHAADTIEGYIHTGYGSFDRTYTVQVSNYTGNITILHPYIVEYKSGSNETWVSTVEVIMSDEPFSKYFVNRDFGASAVNSINAITGCYTATSGTLTCASWQGNGNMPDSYVMEGTNWLDITDSGISLSDSDIPGKILQYLADNDLIDVSKDHYDEGEYQLHTFNYDTNHDFRQDVYNVDIPIPELSNLSYNGFTVNNADDDLFLDVYVTTKFLGLSHGGAAENANVAGFNIDESTVINSHRYNMTNYDLAYNNQNVIISDLYPGVDIVSDLVSDFVSWTSLYPTHKSLPDYSWMKHSSNAYTTTYNRLHNYNSSQGSSDLEKLTLCGQGVVVYYVRFYTMMNGEMVNGKWISYCFKTYADSTSSLIVGDVAATPSGNPSQTNTVNFRQDTDGNIEQTTYSWRRSDPYGNVITDMDTTDLWNTVNGLVSSVGQIPALIAVVFQFMPSWLLAMIAVGIGAVVILRFVGR